MSLSIYLRGEEKEVSCVCPECDNKYSKKVTENIFSANITHNLASMASEADLYDVLWRPEEIGASKANDIVEKLEEGLTLLKEDPERFKAFNPTNGWGKYEDLVQLVERYLKACVDYPEAPIVIHR